MYEYKVTYIKKIYDGDTITVTVDLGFNVTVTETFRLYGINTPELRGEQKVEGYISRDYLRNIMYTAFETDQEIWIKTRKDKKGKYGRWLGEIYINDVNINEQLVTEGYAVEYMKK